MAFLISLKGAIWKKNLGNPALDQFRKNPFRLPYRQSGLFFNIIPGFGRSYHENLFGHAGCNYGFISYCMFKIMLFVKLPKINFK